MEHASVQDPTTLGSEQAGEMRQFLLQRASSEEKRVEMTTASEPQSVVRLSWPGQGCGLDIFGASLWWNIIPTCLGYRKHKWILKVGFL